MNLSHVDCVSGNARQRPNLFHARSCAPSLHPVRQMFEKAGAWFWPVQLVSVCVYYCSTYYKVGQLFSALFSCLLPNCTNFPSPFKFWLRPFLKQVQKPRMGSTSSLAGCLVCKCTQL
jgi:hypothetical protein